MKRRCQKVLMHAMKQCSRDANSCYHICNRLVDKLYRVQHLIDLVVAKRLARRYDTGLLQVLQ